MKQKRAISVKEAKNLLPRPKVKDCSPSQLPDASSWGNNSFFYLVGLIYQAAYGNNI
jgi:hypothetical protein